MGSASSRLIRSKRRVIDHGEVLTPAHIVCAMLDLVGEEVLQLGARFLDPACGDGNFLLEVLRRRLLLFANVASDRERYELGILESVSTLYGIDILFDNIERCRERLYSAVADTYDGASISFYDAIRCVLHHNIIHGDTLRMEWVGSGLIAVVEWLVGADGMVGRRDYYYRDLVMRGGDDSDLFGGSVVRPFREYVAVHYLELGGVYGV